MSTSDAYFVKPYVPFEIEQARAAVAVWFKPGQQITLAGLMTLDSGTLAGILRAGQVIAYDWNGWEPMIAAYAGAHNENLRRLILAPAVLMLIADLRVTL